MKILSTIAAAHGLVRPGIRVLVPTMGALHRGHLELIRIARERAGCGGELVVSAFVNPLQFEPGSDFEKYPRPFVEDEAACRNAGVDFLFRPAKSEMYRADSSVYVEETSLSLALCGKSRPGHFRGVCTIVAKLFNALSPHAAVFGEKDFQQLAVIRRMVRDLNLSVEIVAVPTVRESDGLALSSRNQYLNDAERAQAPVLRLAALTAFAEVTCGQRSSAKVLDRVRKIISAAPAARIDYAEIVDADSLQAVESISANSLLALAVFIGKTRLIDNIRFE